MIDLELSSDLERHFRQYASGGESRELMADLLLGDDSYVERLPMPKYNGPVCMLTEPRVAVRYANKLGVSTSKHAHALREDYFRELATSLEVAWNDLVDRCVRLFGKPGPLVSGVYRSHFPDEAKDRLRFLAHGKVMAADAARLHHYLSTTRSPLFT